MSSVYEIAPDIFRISTFVPEANLQFNQFLIRDEQPLLYHTGQNALFPAVRAAVESLIDIRTLRWIGFSHNEADENGALNHWLDAAPRATALSGLLAAVTGINDHISRPPRILEDGDQLCLGRHIVRFLVTPYVPHSWESTLLFDETESTLFCSDLLLQRGNPAPVDEAVLDNAIRDLQEGQQTPFRDPIPCTPHTQPTLMRLAALRPRCLAIMHGASYQGHGDAVLAEYAAALPRILAP